MAERSNYVGHIVNSFQIVELFALTIFIFWQYGLKRVFLTSNRQFHMPVLCILLVCSISGLISSIFSLCWVQQCKDLEPTAGPQFGPVYNTSIVFFQIYWGADLAVHGIFVIKYWLASRKLSMFLSYQQTTKSFEYQAKAVFAVAILWTLTSMIIVGYLLWDPTVKEENTWDTERQWKLGLFCDFPAILFFFMLCWAYQTMKSLKVTDFSLSLSQVCIQLSFNFAYALVNILPFCVKDSASPLYLWMQLLAVTVNCASLAVLAQTLAQICDL